MKNMPMTAAESVLAKLVRAYADEGKARELLAAWRWPKGPVCPHCQNAGDKRISKLAAHSTSQSGGLIFPQSRFASRFHFAGEKLNDPPFGVEPDDFCPQP